MKSRWSIIMKNISIVLASLFLVITTSIVACGSPSTISMSEKTDIYSAVILQLYSIDHNYEETFNLPVLYMVETIDDEAGGRHITEPTSVVLEESVKQGILANLDDISADLIWVKRFSDVTWDEGRVEGGGAIITLGNIQLQEDGSVQVAISIHYASLGAEGLTYIVEQVEGNWQVIGDTGVRWMA
jgi:hypothetical protein